MPVELQHRVEDGIVGIVILLSVCVLYHEVVPVVVFGRHPSDAYGKFGYDAFVMVACTHGLHFLQSVGQQVGLGGKRPVHAVVGDVVGIIVEVDGVTAGILVELVDGIELVIIEQLQGLGVILAAVAFFDERVGEEAHLVEHGLQHAGVGQRQVVRVVGIQTFHNSTVSGTYSCMAGSTSLCCSSLSISRP